MRLIPEGYSESMQLARGVVDWPRLINEMTEEKIAGGAGLGPTIPS